MRKSVGSMATFAAGALLVLGCSTSTPNTGAITTTGNTRPPPTTAARLAGESDGAYVFRLRCAGCHGSKGEGNVGPSLAGIAGRMSVDEQTSIVRSGKGSMVPFEGHLSDVEITAVVDYTRTQLG